jgi:hypothetical protein
MKITDIINTFEAFTRRKASMMPISERHDWLEFINSWLSGTYMGDQQSTDILSRWQQLAKMFPPRITHPIRLYRLVTIPETMLNRPELEFKPAPNVVSSWTSTLVGLDAVAGIAYERNNRTDNARVGIKAMLSPESILATPLTIRDAFITLSHDYFERYPEQYETSPKGIVTQHHPGYPGKNPNFTMGDIDFLHDVLNRPGGHYHQYEWIVETPPIILAHIIRIYRHGVKQIRLGNDDPHGLDLKRTKTKWR